MKVLIIGGNGTIGCKLTAHFSKKYQVIVAGRNSGDFLVDIADSDSVKKMFDNIKTLDAIICTAGEAKWADFSKLSEDDYFIGLRSKLMGQVNIVRIGKDYINKNGSITLTTGILADDPVIKTSSAAMVNGGLHSFVKAVALEMEFGIRINVVSCGVVEDSYEKYKDYFPGYSPIPMIKVINGYTRSLEGKINGMIIRVYD